MKAGMIVTDLDGTLLRDDKTISDFTIDIIKKYQSKGGIFVAATARPVRAARPQRQGQSGRPANI